MPAEMNQSNSQNTKDLIPKSFLQSGKDLPITNEISFKHPIIQEIFDLDKEHFGLYSEEIYYSMINVFLTDPYSYMVYLDNKGLDYEKVTSFQLFCMLYEDYENRYDKLFELNPKYSIEMINEYKNKNSIYVKAFSFFMGIESFFISKDENDNLALGYGNNKFLMDEKTFDYISEFVRKVNGIPEIEKINPEDEWAKKILIEDERDRLKKLSKKKDDNDNPNLNRLGNLISSITWAANGAITPFNRNQLHMFDLIDGIHRVDKIFNYKNTMVGFYSGCIEKKNINFNELHWSSE